MLIIILTKDPTFKEVNLSLVTQVNKKSGKGSWGNPNDQFSIEEERNKRHSEGEQKAIAKHHRKSQLDWQKCRVCVVENEGEKISDIVRRSRRQLEKAKWRLCQHTDFRILLMII